MIRKLLFTLAVVALTSITANVYAELQQIEDDCVAPMKNIALNEDGSWNMDFGGQLRFRAEYWNNFNFGGAGDTSDIFTLWRALVYSDVQLGDNVRVFGEMISANMTDRALPGGTTPLYVDSIDLHQGFVDLSGNLNDDIDLTFRAGRQEYNFGKQRLVSALPWANAMRSWDGFTLIGESEGWNVTGFWSQYVPVRKYEFNQAESDIQFFGVYATAEKLLWEYSMDLYALGLYQKMITQDRRYTVGGRIYGDITESDYDFDIEGGYQFGDLAGGGDINAYFFASEFGYTWEVADGKPRAFVGFDYASGDSSGTGGGKTFNQLFPLGHAFLGYMDVIGRQNIIDVNAGISFNPMEKTTIRIAGYYFWKAQPADSIYNAGGTAIRGASASRDIGLEIDLTAKYMITTRLSCLLGYSHFFAGTAIDQTQTPALGNDDIDFAYAQIQWDF